MISGGAIAIVLVLLGILYVGYSYVTNQKKSDDKTSQATPTPTASVTATSTPTSENSSSVIFTSVAPTPIAGKFAVVNESGNVESTGEYYNRNVVNLGN